MVELKLYSFNVRGINNRLKRRTIFRHLKNKYGPGIFMLQETHSSEEMEQMWRIEWNGAIYFSHGSTNSCGVATLISPGLDLNVKTLHKDNAGRLLALTVQIDDDNEYAVYNIYAPVRSQTQDQLAFLNSIKDVFNNNDSLHIIMGVILIPYLSPI